MEKEKVYCGDCANKWCIRNGNFQFCSCRDFYPRTYVQTSKGDNGVTGHGWYDDRKQGFNFEIYERTR